MAEDSDSQATTLSTQNVRLPDRSSSAVDSSKVKNWIYLKQKETQAQYTKEQTYNELLQDDEDLADLTDFAVTSAGLQRVLGAPLGDQDFESHHAEKNYLFIYLSRRENHGKIAQGNRKSPLH